MPSKDPSRNPGRPSPVVRIARAEELQRLAALAAESFRAFVAPETSEEGIRTFLGYAAPEALRDRSGDHLHLAAEASGELVGMAEVRPPAHLAMLFVVPGRQRIGIGELLVDEVLRRVRSVAPEAERISVHATPGAVGFYERRGFVAKAAERTVDGLRFVTMERPLP